MGGELAGGLEGMGLVGQGVIDGGQHSLSRCLLAFAAFLVLEGLSVHQCMSGPLQVYANSVTLLSMRMGHRCWGGRWADGVGHAGGGLAGEMRTMGRVARSVGVA